MFAIRSLACAAAVVAAAGCVAGGVPEEPPPALDRIAEELGTPPPGTAWLRERDLDGPMCVLRVRRTPGGDLSARPGPGADPDAGLLLTLVPQDEPVTDGVALDVEGTACARGLYGARRAHGVARARVRRRPGGSESIAFSADLAPVGGPFARAGRRVRVLGMLHLSAEASE